MNDKNNIDNLLKELEDIISSGTSKKDDPHISPSGQGLLIRREHSEPSTYEEILEFIKDGRYNDAIAHLEKFLAVNPEHQLAHNDLGVLYIQEGNKEKAMEHLEMSVSLAPEHINARKNLADLYLNMGNIDKGVQLYINIMDENPKDIETLIKLGDVCLEVGRIEGAKMFYKKVMNIDPGNTYVQEQLRLLPDNSQPQRKKHRKSKKRK